MGRHHFPQVGMGLRFRFFYPEKFRSHWEEGVTFVGGLDQMVSSVALLCLSSINGVCGTQGIPIPLFVIEGAPRANACLINYFTRTHDDTQTSWNEGSPSAPKQIKEITAVLGSLNHHWIKEGQFIRLLCSTSMDPIIYPSGNQ